MSKIDLSQYARKDPRIDLSQYQRKASATAKEQENPLVNHLKGFHGESGDAWWQLPKKAVGKFATEIAGLPHLAARGVEAMTNAGNKMYGAPVGMYGMGTYGKGREKPPNVRVNENAPQTDYAQLIPSTESIQKGVRPYIDIEPRPSNAAQRVAYEGLDFGLNSLPFAQVNKLAKGASLLDKFSKVGKTAGIGAGIGATSGIAQEAGAPKLAADLASIVATPYAAAKLNPKNIYSAFQKIPETAAKLPLKIMGLGPKGLNIEAAQAARDLGIDLPAAALTDSGAVALANQHIGKTPFLSSTLNEKYANADKQMLDTLQDIYKDIGPKKTPEIKNEISRRYLQAVESLPQNAVIKPAHSLDAIKKIKIDTALPSPQEKDLVKSLEELGGVLSPKINKKYGAISQEFGEIKLPAQDINISTLIGTKRSLNAQIKWDTEPGVKEQLKKVLAGVKKDIAEYGKTNPEWYKTFKEADALYGNVAKRAKVEKLLSGRGENYSTGNVQHSALSKTIHNPETAEFLKTRVSPEVFSKIEKLGKISRAFALKSKNAPNPSGTASTANIINLGVGAVTGSLGLPYLAALGAAGVGVTSLLTDKKFLDLALKYAQRPNLVSVVPLNKRIKDVTGYSAVALNRELQRAQEREE